MPLPDFQSLLLPVLRFAEDGQEHSTQQALDQIASALNIPPDELLLMLPSGQPIFANRIQWARTYLKHAGLLSYPQRGAFQITERGRAVLAEGQDRLDIRFLSRFPEFVAFRNGHQGQPTATDSSSLTQAEERKTPEELLAEGITALRQTLSEEILARIKECSPSFFETLVVELLVKMGYGGSRLDAGGRVGRSGDGGIDGLIKEDRLGLDVIYLQAKRWADKTVGRPDIQQFVGALQGQRARKGVYITTSTFSDEARRYVDSIESKIVLIDGQRLAGLMIDFEVGVTTVSTYQVKRIDSDYFNGDAY
jgi:restriction system protein